MAVVALFAHSGIHMALASPGRGMGRQGSSLCDRDRPGRPPHGHAVVFWAGYPEKERVLRGTIGDMAEKLSQDKEKFMGLLLVGRFLNGSPYDAAMEQSYKELEMGKRSQEQHQKPSAIEKGEETK